MAQYAGQSNTLTSIYMKAMTATSKSADEFSALAALDCWEIRRQAVHEDMSFVAQSNITRDTADLNQSKR